MDVCLFLQEAEATGTPAFASAFVKQFYDQAINDGLAAEDMTRVVQVLEKLAGVEIAR